LTRGALTQRDNNPATWLALNRTVLTDSFTALSSDTSASRLVSVTLRGLDDVDAITGTAGNDTYSFSASASGTHTISDPGGNNDAISITGTGALTSLNFEHVGSDLVIQFNGQQVTVQNQYVASNTVESVQFGSGQSYYGYQLQGTYKLVTDQTPGNGNTDWVLAGTSGTDELTGGDTTNQKALIFGNAPGDSLTGRDGSDLLVGGAGNDSLNGGAATTGWSWQPAMTRSSSTPRWTAPRTSIDLRPAGRRRYRYDRTVQVDFDGVSDTQRQRPSGERIIAVNGNGDNVAVGNVHVIFDISTGNLYYDQSGGTSSGRTAFAQVDLSAVTGTVDAC
jgi:Ca2+-binding RTX toxin-like protein